MLLTIDLGFELAACVLCVMCVVYVATGKRTRGVVQRRVFRYLLASIAIMSFSDFNANIISFTVGQAGTGAIFTLNELYFLAQASLSPIFTCYVMCLNGSVYRFSTKRRILYWIPVLITDIYILANIFTHRMFYIEGGFYRRGDTKVIIVISALYVVISVFNFAAHFRVMTVRTSLTLIFAVALYIAGVVIQSFNAGWMMETFLTSIGLILVMCLVECDESMYDQTSMLFNKKAFRERAVQLMDMNVSFRVLSVRLSNLDFYLNILSAEEGHTLRIMITNWLLTEMAGNDVLFYQVEENRLAFFILKDYEETEKRLLQRLDERMRKPWNIGKYQVRLQAVVLPLEIPKDAKSPSQLYQLFDLEENGSRSAVTILTGEQKEEMENSIEIEKCVRRNLDGNNIQVYYQPIWDADSRSIVACEALMRVFDQQLGFVRPDRIVGLAEKNGTISEIDRMVLEKVCRFIRDNKPQKYGLRYIEVNMSTYEMFTPDVVGTYKDILSKYGVPIDMINIEFTETLNNSDSEVFAKTKKELSEAGFTLSIDDFGTEFSNMGRLFSNDFMNVKVDKSLLWAADKDEYTRSFLGSLMEMLRKMGFNALQEGVETREQLDFVTAHGCNLIQGFYFSKPIPQDDFLNYLREFNARG